MACIRKILPSVKDFKAFWKAEGPFAYALTSNEYPPVLLEPEEWIFGQDAAEVIKELMQFKRSKMAFVRAPFNADNKGILRPESLSAWKITRFPEAWNSMACDAFVPQGHLTRSVMDELAATGGNEEKEAVEAAFFRVLEGQLEQMGYVWLRPRGDARFASVRAYVEEWEADEKDAGLY